MLWACGQGYSLCNKYYLRVGNHLSTQQYPRALRYHYTIAETLYVWILQSYAISRALSHFTAFALISPLCHSNPPVTGDKLGFPPKNMLSFIAHCVQLCIYLNNRQGYLTMRKLHSWGLDLSFISSPSVNNMCCMSHISQAGGSSDQSPDTS